MMIPMTEPMNLARLLLDRFRWFDEALRTTLEERLGFEITSAQSLLFADLTRGGERQADIARRLGVSRQAVNELVRTLEHDGLVEIVPDPTSGRSKLVRPTAEGRRTVAVAGEAFAELETELRSRIGRRAVDQLRNALAADWGDSPGAVGPPQGR